MTVKNVKRLRKYSLEDFLFYELKAMKKFGMTNVPLMVPVEMKEGNETDPSIDHYDFPSVPLDHAVLDPLQWNPKIKAITKRNGRSPFENHSLLRRSLYSSHLRWWLKEYTLNEDILVINYDHLAKDVKSVFEQISNFAGIPLPYANGQDPSKVGINFDKKARLDKAKHRLRMRDDTRKFLTDFYAPYNAELESMLGPEWSVEKLGWNDFKPSD